MKTILSWSRESFGKGIAHRHPCRGFCNALTTMVGGGHSNEYGMGNTTPYVLEIRELAERTGKRMVVASRGRGGIKDTHQEFEIQDSGCTNAITSVQKDNLIVELWGLM